MIFQYEGELFPEFLKNGNACQFIAPVAKKFCQGRGLDVGAGKWPLESAQPVDLCNGGDAMNLPEGQFDYIFSSHCLEHLQDPIGALEHWKSRLLYGGVLFLYLPHPDMGYWLPENNRKHLHSWRPKDMARILKSMNFKRVIHSGRDMAWSFSVVGFRG